MVQVVRFKRALPKKEIVVVNFQNHPDVIGGFKVSADWPGFVRRTVEAALDGVNCLFVNGAQGDTNHIIVDPRPGENVGDFRSAQRGCALLQFQEYGRDGGRCRAYGVGTLCSG